MIRRPRRSTRTDHRLPYTSLFRSIAEVGCGAGEILAELQKLRPDATFTGFESSPQAFGLCGPKGNEGLNFYHEDITKSAKGGFDALLVIDIFEHVPDYMGFITALKDKAEIKVFHIPLDLSVQALLRASPYMFIRKEVRSEEHTSELQSLMRI